MMFFKKIWNPKTLIFNLIEKFGSDKLYLKVWFHSCMGYWMDFHNPQTFNEKIQYLKIANYLRLVRHLLLCSKL